MSLSFERFKQDLCQKKQFIRVIGYGSIESQDSVVECTEFLFNKPIEKILISNSQNKLIVIEEYLYIRQIKVKNLKKDFVFKSGHSSYLPIRSLEYTKNHNYFYLCNGKSQLKSFQVNNGKIKQISSMMNKDFKFLRQIFVEDDHFIFVAIPKYILQYNINTKLLLKQYEINNYYCDNCFDFSIQDQVLVTQISDSINVWFLKQNSVITKKGQSNFCQYMKLYRRQIYELSQNKPNQLFMLCIYQITQDNKEIILMNTIEIHDKFHFICRVYSLENIYKTLQNYDFTKQKCQSFSIQQIDNKYRYLAIIEKIDQSQYFL